MSFTMRDLLYDKLPEAAISELVDDEKPYVDGLDNLIVAISDFYSQRRSDALFELADEWERDHMPPDTEINSYVRGVHVGLLMAAREVSDR